jgi:hypothetical protein
VVGEQARRRWQFGVSSLLSLLLVAAVALAYGVNVRNECELTLQSGQLPVDDGKLAEWLREQSSIHDPQITRDGTELRVRFETREWFQTGPRDFPPWAELGYQQIESMSWSWVSQSPLTRLADGWGKLPTSVRSLLVALLVAGGIATYILRRAAATPKVNKELGP